MRANIVSDIARFDIELVDSSDSEGSGVFRKLLNRLDGVRARFKPRNDKRLLPWPVMSKISS